MRLPPRWRKIAADVVQHRGPMTTLVAAIAAGAFAVAAISTAYAILDREINRSYLATNPPAALIDVDHLDAADLAAVGAVADVTWAQAGGKVWARVQVGPAEWLPLLLIVVNDFTAQHLDLVRLERGAWPENPDAIVLERSALPLANAALGRRITLQTGSHALASLRISGSVYDPSLAPAAQQQTVYGYVTPATLRFLGYGDAPRLLQVMVTGPMDRPAMVEREILGVVRLLESRGHRVGEVRIPPRQHPHWSQMKSVVNLLLSFSVLTCLLAAVLTATLTASLLAPQVRQIAVMKAIGAHDSQIIVLYASLIVFMAVLATGIGLPLGCAAGRALARAVAHNQNFDLASLAVPAWVYLGEIAVSIGLPLLFALLPIVTAARRPVRESLDDHGVTLRGAPARTRAAGGSRGRQWLPRYPAVTLALRNALRRRSRLVLTVLLLATAGALFIATLNLSAAWQRSLVEASAERHYDAAFEFADPEPTARVAGVAAAIAGVLHVEQFSGESAALARADGFNLTHTFADGEHGNLQLAAVPPDGDFITPQVTRGQWLRNADPLGVALNAQAQRLFPNLDIGNALRIVVRGRVLQLHAVGFLREHLAGATIYMASAGYAAALADPGHTRGLRVAYPQGDEAAADKRTAAIEHALDAAGFNVVDSTTRAQLGRANRGHLFILIFTLQVLSLLMALVGVLGLGATLATGIQERTRELGVMRALGASRATLVVMLIGEGLFTGLLSVLFAALLSAPATLAVARIVGTEALGGSAT